MGIRKSEQRRCVSSRSRRWDMDLSPYEEFLEELRFRAGVRRSCAVGAVGDARSGERSHRSGAMNRVSTRIKIMFNDKNSMETKEKEM